MEKSNKFEEVAEHLKKAHDSIFEDSDYKLTFAEDEANIILTYLQEKWKFYKEKCLGAGKPVSEAVKSYKPEETLWMLYCRLASETIRRLNYQDRKRLEGFMKTKGLVIDSHGYHFANMLSPTFDGIPYHFFAVKIEETKDFKTALEKLHEALV